MKEKIWKIKKNPPKNFFKKFPSLNPIILKLLYHRGLKDQKSIKDFFEPKYENLFKKLKDPEVEKIKKRLKKAIESKEKIGIWGDYDVDGISSVALLWELLSKLNALDIEIYIPDRIKEGYGLNKEGLKKLKEKGVKLLFTVDCGISNFQEIELANKAGIDVIILDHHQRKKSLPNAYAILHNEKLAAVGIGLKLAQAILKDYLPNWEEELKWFLDLAALGTIADLVPLLGENRIIAKWGLLVLSKTKRKGLLALYDLAKVNKNKINNFTVSFIIGPRLNATGRVSHAKKALQLLLAKDQERAFYLAKELEEINRKRQNLTEKILKEAIEQVNLENPILVITGKNWERGILGLVASKLAEKYMKPCFAIGIYEKEAVGSCRSNLKLNIVEFLTHCEPLLIKFGGHRKAAGFTLAQKDLDLFKEKLLEIARAKLDKESLQPRLEIDVELQASDINFDLLKDLKKFEPWGEGNSKPLFLLKNVEIKEIKNSEILKMKLKKENLLFNAIGFDIKKEGLKPGEKIDLVFSLEEDNWLGFKNILLKIIDWKFSKF